MSLVVLRVLGGARLDGWSGEVNVGGLQAERLVGMLVAAGGAPLDHDVLSEELWPDRRQRPTEPPLRMAISRVRARLAAAGLPDGIIGGGRSYQLNVPSDRIDVDCFTSLVDRSRRLSASAPDRAISYLDGALALWRGEPFGRLASETWATAVVARLGELRLAAEEELFELELGRHREAFVIDRIRRATELAPLRERRWGQLAVALFRLGRQSEALRAVDRARATLRDELGISLGEQLRTIELALLRHDPELTATTRPGTRAAPAAVSSPLLGRDPDIRAIRSLLDANNLVTVHGLAGVGKSAVVRAVAAEEVGRVVIVAALDGLSDREAVWRAVAGAAGIAWAEDVDDLAPDVVARLAARPTLLVLDGAESGVDAAAEVAETLLLHAPSVKLLVTSRVPVRASGEVRYPLDVLQLGPDGDGPAAQLFRNRAGLGPGPFDDDTQRAIARVCQRSAGLPLALELAAASVDLHGLLALATTDKAATGAGPVHDALRWAAEVLPEDSERLLLRATMLPGGFSLGWVASLIGVGADDARRVLAPLVQARLVTATEAGPSGVRYRQPQSIGDVLAESMSSAERDLSRPLILGHLTALGAAVGGVDERIRLFAVPAVEADLVNLHHWLRRSLGTDAGLRLAVAIASTMSQTGGGAEGRRTLDAHIAATPSADPLLIARATAAASAVVGFFAAHAIDAPALEAAADTAADHQSWRLWLFVQGQLAIARGWSGDQAGALAVLDDPVARTRLAELDDPWMHAQRDQLAALALAVGGQFAAARAGLGPVIDRFLVLDDPASALRSLFLRAWLARTTDDMAGATTDLLKARELAPTGAARGTQALVAAELAHLARRRDEPGAVAMMMAAIDDLERAGNLRSAAAQRSELGTWRIADGDAQAGLADLRRALPTLLRTDRRAAALALAEIASAMAPTDAAEGARLAGKARRMLLDGSGLATPAEHARVMEITEAVGAPARTGGPRADITDEAILLLAGCVHLSPEVGGSRPTTTLDG